MIKKITLGLLAFSLALSSCKKQLDLLPTDAVTVEVAFNSVAALQKGLNTAYARYSAARAGNSLTASITSDELKFGPDNGGANQFGFRLQYDAGSGDVTGLFPVYYQVIDMCNRVLAVADGVPAAGTEVSQKEQIKGQLLALRAMSHYELLEAYSKPYNPADPLGVPIVLVNCLDCEPARNTVGEVIAQVEKDLNDGKALLPAAVSAGYNDLSLNQLSVTAYQARVALYKKEWQRASDLATTVISSGIKPLVGATTYSGIWNDLNTNEILFRSRLENSALLGSNWTQTNGSILFSPSDKLTASYSASDVRSSAFIGTNARGRFVKKFSQSSRGGSIVDLKGIRTAEMYLIRAEAKAELNDLAGAATDINAIRTQRITGHTPVAYADKATAINDVLLERYKELAFEGFRFYDFKRRGLNLQRAATDVDSPLWQTLSASDYRFVFPIPSQELLANRKMIQNTGY
ncbi:MAG: RagB/SusD family nutrient uptake outer membrane protein [Chitinophagaceae bacterium]